jgi:hypothetical protein
MERRSNDRREYQRQRREIEALLEIMHDNETARDGIRAT